MDEGEADQYGRWQPAMEEGGGAWRGECEGLGNKEGTSTSATYPRTRP